MFKKILLAVDGSEASQKAVNWAIQAYQEIPDVQITLLYVHQPYYLPVADANGYLPIAHEPADLEVPEATPAFAAWKQFPDQQRVTYQTLQGNPANIICEEAKNGQFDAIVLGSEGHGVVSSVLLGSVSAKVLHHAPCSVLIVR
ncbi:universal stress protein [Effusibacillus lacus]|uniref:Universal stress protein UspA n=1 Tax=Effusibacillus lacus TaxID=1348429 RepID=A0A292YN91_9BACL|nr:universal stress protein [Effusibacillus lacus]TCS76086.1 nucleotide-binding universal stress UspA family protein [Effusibacillus lacus]GAX91398.1 universal stress protein UspA [Effusibacillus lacus]